MACKGGASKTSGFTVRSSSMDNTSVSHMITFTIRTRNRLHYEPLHSFIIHIPQTTSP